MPPITAIGSVVAKDVGSKKELTNPEISVQIIANATYYINKLYCI